MSSVSRVFIKSDNKFRTALDVETFSKMPPGTYKGSYDARNDIAFYEANVSVHDGIVDLPTPEYQELISDVNTFFSPEARAKFEEMNLTHKYNILLHGRPGTGKSILLRRISNKVIEMGGVVLINPQIPYLQNILDPLNKIQPETNILVVLEEFEEEAENYERELLNLLDGPNQMKNVMYIATTNFLDKVPRRMMRPGRFSNSLEIKLPDDKARRFYLSQKFGDQELIDRVVSMTKGFTIDELKEVVKQTYCLGKDLRSVTEAINKNPSRFIAEKAINLDEDEDDAWHPTAKRLGRK